MSQQPRGGSAATLFDSNIQDPGKVRKYREIPINWLGHFPVTDDDLLPTGELRRRIIQLSEIDVIAFYSGTANRVCGANHATGVQNFDKVCFFKVEQVHFLGIFHRDIHDITSRVALDHSRTVFKEYKSFILGGPVTAQKLSTAVQLNKVLCELASKLEPSCAFSPIEDRPCG
ncbi:hypothetical protein BDR04DRAFT_1140836 [Suillus decipiens]|nr:hypothetical protein BDR04DRAFT_1140836 [Suillus decipiens]